MTPRAYDLPSGPLVRTLRELEGKEPCPMIGDPSPHDWPSDEELGLAPEPIDPDPTEWDEEDRP